MKADLQVCLGALVVENTEEADADEPRKQKHDGSDEEPHAAALVTNESLYTLGSDLASYCVNIKIRRSDLSQGLNIR